MDEEIGDPLFTTLQARVTLLFPLQLEHIGTLKFISECLFFLMGNPRERENEKKYSWHDHHDLISNLLQQASFI